MSQCFAYNQNRQRCQSDAGHTGDHAIAITWADDECYDPSVSIAELPPPLQRIGGSTTTMPDAVLMNMGDDPGPLPTDICFGCDCPRILHQDGGCEAHACKTFID